MAEMKKEYEVSCFFLRKLYREAVKRKNYVEKPYSDAQDIYFPENEEFYRADRTTISDMDHNGRVCWNDKIPETAERYARQVEKSLFPKGQTWAEMDKMEATDEEVLAMQKASERVMEYLEASNFYQEIPRVSDDLVMGTGCIKQYPTGNKKMPIAYTHVPLSQVYALVDGFHEPRTVFYLRKEITLQQLRDVYGEQVSMQRPDVEDNSEVEPQIDMFNVLEISHRLDDGKYIFIIYTEDFSVKLYEKIRPMPTFIFSRHKKTNSDSIYGWGLGMKKLPLAYQLNHISQLNALGANRAIDPPYIYPVQAGGRNGTQAGGSNYSIKLRNGAVTPVAVGDYYTGGEFITPLYPQAGYTIGLEHKRDLENDLKQGFFIDQLADRPDQDNKYRTASELSMRDEKFLEYFNSYYNNLERELVMKIFEGALIMLQEYTSDDIIKAVDIQDVAVRFVNPVVKFRRLLKLRELMDAVEVITAIAGREVAMMALNIEELLKLVTESYSLGKDLILEGDDLETNMQNVAGAKQQAMGMGEAPPVQTSEVI